MGLIKIRCFFYCILPIRRHGDDLRLQFSLYHIHTHMRVVDVLRARALTYGLKFNCNFPIYMYLHRNMTPATNIHNIYDASDGTVQKILRSSLNSNARVHKINALSTHGALCRYRYYK